MQFAGQYLAYKWIAGTIKCGEIFGPIVPRTGVASVSLGLWFKAHCMGKRSPDSGTQK